VKTLAQLQAELHRAEALCDYWSKRRRGQVGNCPSDSEHQLDADRALKRIEYQISELKKTLTNV
jgi:50S ribosomal subunit-associated GTPase HflX